MSRLFDAVTLPLTRTLPGHVDNNGNWVDGATDPSITTFNCNLQPYQDGHSQITLPEGIKSTDAFVAYTKTEIKTADEFNMTSADQTTYKSRQYYAHAAMDWTKALGRFGTGRLDHYEVIFIRLPRDPGY